VYSLYKYQYSDHNSHLWRGSKCYQKGTLRTHRKVLESQKVPLRFGKGPKEKYSLVGEDWGHSGTEMGLGKRR